MRIAELSRETRIPVPTIKYYLREGLLPPGDFSSRNQAQYGERHVRRLRLIRALLEVARLPIAAIRDLLTEIDQYAADPHKAIGTTLRAAEPVREQPEGAGLSAAEEELDALIARRNWRVSPDDPARRTVARALATLRELGAVNVRLDLDAYAEAAERIAEADLETVRDLTDRDTQLYVAVFGTILSDAVIVGLRRLAQADRSARVFGPAPEE